MCGIAGFQAADDHVSRGARLADALCHRGPDGAWVGEHGGHCLVQTRLAVMDLSDAVVYPMPNEAGDVWLAYNGEVYDHRRLKRELEGLGHTFATDCDAEVIVHGWEQWGTGVFSRLNGMFALALVDERSGEVVLARDRFGIKPLVRTTSGPLAFASDALALVAAGLSPGVVDERALAEYLAFHYVPAPRTGIVGLEDVAPGTFVRRRADGSEEVGRFASASFDGPAPSEPVALDELEATLSDAVRRQLVADVDVGVFLSSGVDSALVLSFAAEHGARPQAFTVGFAGHGDYDERERAAELARHFGVAHHVVDLRTSFGDAVGRLGAAFDRPFADSSAIAACELSRLAREHVTVALSGTGGDELFAGYYRHRAHRLLGPLGVVPDALLRRVAARSPARAARSSARSLFTSYAGRVAAAGLQDELEQYVSLVTVGRPETTARALRAPLPVDGVAGAVAARAGLQRTAGGTVVRDVSSFDLTTYLAGDLLVKEDRSSMAVGLEARVPLLDDAMLEIARRMPDAQKLSWRAGKLALRELAARRLPPSVGRGRKRGFAVPLADLFAGPWRADATAWLRDAETDWVDGGAAADLVGSPAVPAADLWALCALVAWEQALGAARTKAAALAPNPAPR